MKNTLRGSPILLAALVALAAPGRAQSWDALVNGEALVRLTAGSEIAVFNELHGSTLLDSIAGRNIHLVQIPDGMDPQAFKTQADADPSVAWCELNYYGQVAEARARCFYFLTGPEAQPYIDQPAWDQIGLPAAQQATSGAGVTIAVLDTGMDLTHVAFAGLPVLAGWNFVDGTPATADTGDGLDNDGDGDIDEAVGHGTHVTGVLQMIAPDATILPVKVLDSEGGSDNFIVAAGMFYAIDMGADVINVSVGSTYNSDAVRDATAEAVTAGVVVVAAGGNMNTRIPEEFPALNSGAVGVAGVDAADIKGYFSNYHELLTLSAPGVSIYSTLPGNLYGAWDGTSMATPMAAGASALVLSRHPEWPADAGRANGVRIALMSSATSIDALNPEFAGMLGAGRLNAAAAIDQVSAFAAAVEYAAGAAPESVVAADLDGDGRDDVAVANSASGNVSVLLAQPDGTLAAAQDYPTGAGPMAIVAGDYDGDTRLDLATANPGPNSVTVLLNDGSGGFRPATQFGTGPGPRGLAGGDLDGDQDVDLVTANDDGNSLTFLRNDGAGSFSVQSTIPVGDRPYDVRCLDLDGDTDLDLVCVNRGSSTISVARNSGAGSFPSVLHYGTGAEPRAFCVADLDGDLDPDVATANHDSNDVTILANNGSAAFAIVATVQLGDGRRPERLAAADVDCDGDCELIATSGDELLNTVSILLGRGDGTFLPAVDYPVPADPAGVACGRLDSDADLDLVVAGRAAGRVAALLNRGCLVTVTIGDLNCDGAVNAFDIDPFVLALTDPAGYAAGLPECDRAAADVNGDGEVNAFDIDPFVALLSG